MGLSETELQGYAARFETAAAEARRITEGLSEEQARWRPGEKSWSLLECLEHLNITAQLYEPKLETSLTRAEQRGGPRATGPFRHRGRMIPWLIATLENPDGRKLKAPGKFQPIDVPADLRTTVGRFTSAQETFQRFLARADGYDLARIKIVSPVFFLLRMTLGQCFHLNCAHQERHLRQADSLTQHSNFPR